MEGREGGKEGVREGREEREEGKKLLARLCGLW